MRGTGLWRSAVLAAALLTLIPAAGAQAGRSSAPLTVYAAECVRGVGPDFREWFKGTVDHVRDRWAVQYQYVLVDGRWIESGTNTTSVRTFHVTINPVLGFPIVLTDTGTFRMRDSLLGDYDGTFAWKIPGDGHAIGQGVGDSAGGHLKVDILLVDPIGLPAPPSDACHGIVPFDHSYEIMTRF